MAETAMGALSVEITANTAGFDKAVKATEEAINLTGKKLRQQVNEWGKWAVAAVGAATGVAAAVVKSQLSSIRELDNLAKVANTSVEVFQQQSFAVGQAGISQEKYADILKDVNDRIGDFVQTGGGPMVDFFERIGPLVKVSIEDFKNLSGPQALQLYVSSLEKANLSQADMTFFMEAIASDSTMLLPLLRENGKAMAEQAEMAKQLGVGLNQIEVQKALDAQAELSKVGAVIDTALKQATVELAPIIAGVTNDLLTMTREAGGFSEVFSAGMDRAARVVGVFADGLHGIQIIAKGVEIGFRGAATLIAFLFENLTKFGASVTTNLIRPVRALVEMVGELPGLGGQFDSLLSKIDAFQAGQRNAVRGTEEFTQSQVEAVEIAKDELTRLLGEELPSQAIEKAVSRYREAAEEMAAVTSKAIAEATAPTVTPEPEQRRTSVVDQFQQETIGLLEAMGLRFAMTEEAQIAANDREIELLNAQLDAKEISQREHEERVSEIKRKNAELQRNITVSTLQEGFMALASNSKKVQKLLKAAAIAQAVIKGKEAAVSAWNAGMSVGGPWAPLVAAAYTAASIARTTSMINSIKSAGTSVGGGGGGGVPSVATPGGGGGAAAPGGQGQSQSRVLTVNILGNGLTSRDQLVDIFNGFNELLGDGMELNVNTGG